MSPASVRLLLSLMALAVVASKADEAPRGIAALTDCLEEIDQSIDQIKVPTEAENLVEDMREVLRKFLQSEPDVNPHVQHPDPDEQNLIKFVDMYKLPIAERLDKVYTACVHYVKEFQKKTAICDWRQYEHNPKYFDEVAKHSKFAKHLGYVKACLKI
jgi:hypothetical protein